MGEINVKAMENAVSARAGALAKSQSEEETKVIIQEAVAEAKELSIVPDTKVYRLAVWFLGLIVILALIAQALLVWNSGNVKIPEGLVAIGSLAIGALAGMLSPKA